MCAPNVIKNINVKVFNLISRTNETRPIKWHETGKCKCRLDARVCNNKQRWNDDKCRCKCKELIDKDVCEKGCIWNPSNYECECDKSCDVGEYLDYENCKCRKKLVDKLVECSFTACRSAEECIETFEEVKLAKITSAENENKRKCSSCTLYIVLSSIIFTINIGISTYVIYIHSYLKKIVLSLVHVLNGIAFEQQFNEL